VVDNVELVAPTHGSGCYRNGAGQEAKRRNPFCGLDSFRLPLDSSAVNVSLIVTCCTELQMKFDVLGRDLDYGFSTTHMAKPHPRHGGGSDGGCTYVVLGTRRAGNGED
jgi:hypothetical protein